MDVKMIVAALIVASFSAAAGDDVKLFKPEVNDTFEVKTKDGTTRLCWASNTLGAWISVRCMEVKDAKQ